VEEVDRALRAQRASVALALVERRRWQLVAVVLLLLVLLVVALVLLAADPGSLPRLPALPALRWLLLAVALAFSLYVLEKERELARVTRALLREHGRTTELAGRLRDLAELTAAARVVNSAIELETVLGNVLAAALRLLRADDATVLLADDGDPASLRVAASARADVSGAPASGPAAWAATRREPLLLGDDRAAELPGLAGDPAPHAALCAPLAAGDQLVGVLAVASSDPRRAFDDRDLQELVLFAEHAASAIANARQFTAQCRSLEELSEAERRRADLMAMVTHDLKTPLTSVLGYVRLLVKRGDQATPAQRSEYYGHMDRQAQRMLEMVEDLLQSSRIEQGAHTLKREPLDLAELARQVRDDFHGKAPDRRVEISGAQLDEVYGDRGAVEHVLQNLVDNALKYSPPEGAIFVTIEDLSSEVMVGVRDEGSGVPEAELQTVFERFRRARDGGGRGSVGLGLYIVKSLVTAHGGRVWCESPPGAGARFCFTLPRRAPRAAGAAAAASSAARAAPPTAE
jgi:signal transduction histidine kinase